LQIAGRFAKLFDISLLKGVQSVVEKEYARVAPRVLSSPIWQAWLVRPVNEFAGTHRHIFTPPGVVVAQCCRDSAMILHIRDKRFKVK
jgi:hypothetical protein